MAAQPHRSWMSRLPPPRRRWPTWRLSCTSGAASWRAYDASRTRGTDGGAAGLGRPQQQGARPGAAPHTVLLRYVHHRAGSDISRPRLWEHGSVGRMPCQAACWAPMSAHTQVVADVTGLLVRTCSRGLGPFQMYLRSLRGAGIPTVYFGWARRKEGPLLHGVCLLGGASQVVMGVAVALAPFVACSVLSAECRRKQ